MNALVKIEPYALTLPDSDVIRTLQASLYPGAAEASVALVLGYCRAAQLDPMMKPVHIVPMRVKVGDSYQQRDTIMPGVGLYRTQAARTGLYAGQDEPVFGPTLQKTFQKKVTTWDRGNKSEKWVEQVVNYPEWCKVTIYKVVGGVRCAFHAVEYWEENYATAGRDSDTPNEMWARRPRGQIVKCAEAQALRKAFPETVGAQPTAEEMEGRFVDAEPPPQGAAAPVVTMPQRKSEKPAPEPEPEVIDAETGEIVGGAPAPTPAPAPAKAPAQAPAATGGISAGHVNNLRNMIAAIPLEGDALAQFLKRHGVAAIDTTVTTAQFNAMKTELRTFA